MSNDFFQSFQLKKSFILLPVVLSFFIPIFFIPIISTSSSNTQFVTDYKVDDSAFVSNSVYSLSSSYLWPVPGYTRISSSFGYRTAPTAGASSFHSGIDIPAPAGTNEIAIANGTVLSLGWGGSSGYSITIDYNSIIVSYCHTSPTFYVKKGEHVRAGQIVSKVGPLNIYDIPNNPYKDKNGNPTNGASTRTTLSFYCKESRSTN